MAGPLRLLVADCESAQDRDTRRKSVGRSSGESYCETLGIIAPGATCERVTPSDADSPAPNGIGLAAYDAVFLSGSALHLYEDTPETRRLIAFMRQVFSSGTPSFGSCAGLQLAAVAAGGKVRPNPNGAEAPFAHGITLTEDGKTHPLMAGRPPVFDALTLHSDEVAELPPGARVLAGNAVSPIQAAEIRADGSVFWGVQYHPELPPGEIAVNLRRQVDDLIRERAARSPEALYAQADAVEGLDGDRGGKVGEPPPEGFDRALADADHRRLELRNFLDRLVGPIRTARGRH